MKPFLKWAGGKSKLVNEISTALGKGKRLVEPFVGSGAVFMGTNYSSYLLCDSNRDLINVYLSLSQDYQGLVDELRNLFSEGSNTSSFYYSARDEFNSSLCTRTRKSALFIYLNRHSFNGLCRYNKAGQFNVPFGSYKRVLCPLDGIQAFFDKTPTAQFKAQDFRRTFLDLEEGDLVYCDPPYVPISSSSSFTSYSPDGFSLLEQAALAEHARDAASRGFTVVISNHDLPITRDIYSGAAIESLYVRRSISSKANTRGEVRELIAVFSPRI